MSARNQVKSVTEHICDELLHIDLARLKEKHFKPMEYPGVLFVMNTLNLPITLLSKDLGKGSQPPFSYFC